MSKVPDVELPSVAGHLEILTGACITTLTPVIGAGVHSQKADACHPVRGETVRGHLRFWWRTVSQTGPLDQWIDKQLQEEARKRSLQYVRPDGAARLRMREAAIWGSSSKAGLVSVEVQVRKWHRVRHQPPKEVLQSIASVMDMNSLPKGISPISYAAFPLQHQKRESSNACAEVGMGSFQVRVLWNPWVRDLRDEVKNQVAQEIREALWRWIHFGGIGMRWRRGFGALALNDMTGSAEGLRSSPTGLQELCDHLYPQPDGFPKIQAVLLKMKSEKRDSRGTWSAWEACLEPLRSYRQSKKTKDGATKTRGANSRFGKTRWPEADVIRAIHRAKGEVKRVAMRFPRAVLGLPIVFHFKGGDAPDSQLRPQNCANALVGRLPSPFILRPVQIGEFVYPMCIWLEAPRPVDQDHPFVSLSLKVGELEIPVCWAAALPQIEDRFRAMEEREAKFEEAKDVVADFLRYVRQSGFEDVYRSHAT
ncbi:type III-B CRISPR module RAMP protein Cmr1 [Alicyclobacillus fructus]|uniref:type III-B CRISPR module RAMP protein Cmr1 n=1 Tax=Alicyclobacillus fructus TaxID=2816082 RepID=UPI001A8CAE87|nr:type III-B CRISPR module RAMP protein Cmr1 [Alicyclobacillus fructus]